MGILFADSIVQYIDTNWPPESVLLSVIGIIWIVYAWDTYLSYRQFKKCMQNPSVPAEIVSIMDQDTYTKARNYHIDKTKFSFCSNLWDQLLSTVILYYQGIALLWTLSGSMMEKYKHNDHYELIQTSIFLLIGSLITKVIDLPWTVYHTFVLEEKHGFNKQTLGFFVKDKIKKFVVTQAIMIPITCCIVYIVHIGGDYFFISLWVFTIVITLLLITVYADYIAPLFDKFTTLPEGELKTKIENLAASIDFPLKKLYIVEGSKRSSHSNAYFYGFYKNKRIVLFDTLLEEYNVPKKEDDSETEKSATQIGCNNNEILAILGHELGHWKLNHMVKNLIIAQANLFFSFMVFAVLFKAKVFYLAFGFTTQPVLIGLIIVFQYIFCFFNEIMSFLMSILSRRFEFAADAFAKNLNMASYLRSGLIKLNKDNLGFPLNDPLYSAWHHSHPPLLERIQALGKLE